MAGTPQALGNPALKEKHWNKIWGFVNQPYVPGFHLEQLIDSGAFDHKEEIEEESGIASGEFGLEQSLEKVPAELLDLAYFILSFTADVVVSQVANSWAETEFTILPHRDSRDVFIPGDPTEILTNLEDSQMTLQSMMASRFVVGIRDTVEVWDKKLSLLSDTLDEWMTCQRNWMYLESIFGQGDIQKQLPDETSKFLKVDQFWKETMRSSNKNKNVVDATTSDDTLHEKFLKNNELLEQIQKSLEDYLLTKRMAFPRFYFLSNDELLEILAQSREPRAVKPHMRKIFDAMAVLEFEDTPDPTEDDEDRLKTEATMMFSAYNINYHNN